ncbi:FAD/NAD(P)-binding protein, partial [Stygiolobus sp. CP850M]|uniref:FAD-dependent oxidoreductase n=1 Tax=Stygiolobus sp. CP850M TaxID=3133134 RepID=UPI00307D26AA
MQKRVVIVGAGNAGSIVANELVKKIGDKVEITVIEPSDYSLYQPGIVDFVVGHERIESIKREVSSLLDKRVKIVKDKAAKVSPETGKVVTEKGKEIEFDY